MSIITKRVIDYDFLKRSIGLYGGNVLKFPKYTAASGIELMYEIPLADVLRVAKTYWHVEREGAKVLDPPDGIYRCGRCKQKIYIGQKYCHECGIKQKWKVGWKKSGYPIWYDNETPEDYLQRIAEEQRAEQEEMEAEMSSDAYFLKMIEDGIAQAATRNETPRERRERKRAEERARQKEEQEEIERLIRESEKD